jgi:predicted nucleotidyltransferase
MQASVTQSHLRFPLTRLLASAGHVRVLRALFGFGAPLGVAQLAADAGLTPRGTRFVLDSLVSQGIVSVLGQARAQLFVVTTAHPMAAALQALFASEAARWDALQQGLQEGLSAERSVRSAWLYGSVARGEDEPRSDVDLALVVSADESAVVQRARDAAQALGDRLGLQISATVLTPSDVARLRPDDAWWAGLVRDARLLKGTSPARESARCARPTR